MGSGRTTENNTSRQVTLCNGLLNKAYGVLCNAVVAITTVIFSCRGRLHECANHSLGRGIFSMGRGRIENNTSRQQEVTFCKRLLNKAYELATILCYAMIVVFSNRGCLYERVRQHQLRSPGMGRGRTTEYNTSRQVTLCNGLLNKAVVALTVIFSGHGRLHECANNRFSRPKMSSLLVMTLILVMVETAASSSTYWAFSCADGNFTPSSSYSENLRAVAAILPTRVVRTPLLFASDSISSHRGGEVVYALAQCWRLSSRAVCHRCVVAAFSDAQKLCPYREGAIIFRDNCTVGYFNKKIAMFPDDPAIGLAASRVYSPQVLIQSSKFTDAVENLQEAVTHGATMSPSWFATGKIEVKTVDLQVTMYAVAQCLPSTVDQDCGLCLTRLLDEIQLSTGPNLSPIRVASIWCSYRFDFYHFFTGEATLTLPAAGPPGIGHPPSSKRNNEQHNVPTWCWVAIGVAIGVCVTLLLVIAVRCYKNTSEREKTIQLKGRRSEEEAHRDYSGQVESQPSALDGFDDIVQMAKKKEIAIFLDYDGTLAPIVRDPERAYISNEMRGVLQNVANLFRTSIVTGRDIKKVSDFVRINNISYAGCHGTDIKIASTSEIEELYQPAEKYVDMINEVHNFLVNATGDINGTYIEHKKFCVSLHYRNVAEEDLPRVERVVAEIVEKKKDHVKHTKGHMVHEFGPPISWNKGHAVLFMLEKFGEPFPIYIGDDQTDENVFKVFRERKNGIGILVAQTGRETSAYYSLKDPAQVMDFLKMLVNWKNETQE